MSQLDRLKWQCRRGTKELDLLLNRYLETGYLLADQQEQALFEELLALEDDQLSGVLIGELAPGMEKFVALGASLNLGSGFNQ
ncbi:MAG: succinate dehydrogenase assembly factor 2 [Methylococcaceae bacterium]